MHFAPERFPSWIPNRGTTAVSCWGPVKSPDPLHDRGTPMPSTLKISPATFNHFDINVLKVSD